MNYTLSPCRGVQWTYHVSCWQAKLPVNNKKNPLDSWVSVQVGEPKITWTLLIRSSFKNGKATYVVLVHCFSMIAFILPFENVSFNLHQQICDF